MHNRSTPLVFATGLHLSRNQQYEPMDKQIEELFDKLIAYKKQQGLQNMEQVAQKVNDWMLAQGGFAFMPTTKQRISQWKSKEAKNRIGEASYNCLLWFLKENYKEKEVSND